jgi:hypothetical protein
LWWLVVALAVQNMALVEAVLVVIVQVQLNL